MRAGASSSLDKEAVITSCWAAVTSCPLLEDFLPCAAVWLEWAAIQFQNKEVSKLLGHIIKRVQATDSSYDTNPDLRDALLGVARRRSPGLAAVLSLPNFLSVFTMITAEEVRAGLARALLSALQQEPLLPSPAPVLRDLLVSVCSVLADSVTALTSTDEARQVRHVTTVHCGPRGCSRRSQLYEHLF